MYPDLGFFGRLEIVGEYFLFWNPLIFKASIASMTPFLISVGRLADGGGDLSLQLYNKSLFGAFTYILNYRNINPAYLELLSTGVLPGHHIGGGPFLPRQV